MKHWTSWRGALPVSPALETALGFSPRLPIVQGVLAECGGPALVAAVARAGAVPTLAVHCLRPREASRWFARVAAHTRRPMIVAFTGDWEREEVLDAALAAGHRCFQTFWWNSERLVPRIRAAGGRALMQAGTVEQILESQRLGADGLILQGTNAGGPVRSALSVECLIEMARGIVGTGFPIIAGGGLADGNDIRAVLEAGADAAMLGTRFLLTEESSAPRRDKARLARTNSGRLLLDTRLVGPWPCAARHRLIPTPDADRASLFAGTGIDRIHRIDSVERVVRNLSRTARTRPQLDSNSL
ncbi:MAG: NAD(P)H-dependent flavin oxidoreductase [Armatimonadota bacterium]